MADVEELEASIVVNADHEYTQALNGLLHASNHLHSLRWVPDYEAMQAAINATKAVQTAIHRMSKLRRALNDAQATAELH